MQNKFDGTPFELGRLHKLAGIKADDKRVPWKPGDKNWPRYVSGRMSVSQAEQDKATGEKAKPQGGA